MMNRGEVRQAVFSTGYTFIKPDPKVVTGISRDSRIRSADKIVRVATLRDTLKLTHLTT
jgi:hypothetical protein